jgi:hypothetical protein
MATPIRTTLDFGNGAGGITGLSDAQSPTEPVTLQQALALIERNPWKDDVRAGASTNVNLASPGASVGGVAMVSGDRFLARGQTAQMQNGIYVWNGAAVAATRALDANTFDELESAVVRVSEGTDAGTKWAQTQTNGVLGTNNVIWASSGASAPAASETVSGIAEIATQAETDAGTDDERFVTPMKGKTASWSAKRFSATIGDGSATSYAVTHNLGTDDVDVTVRETGGAKRVVITDVEATSTTTVTIKFNTAPASNAFRVTVTA